MATSLFVDTWGWITLRNKREHRHLEVNDLYRAFRGTVYTTDYVLDETITLLYKRYPDSAQASTRSLLALVDMGRVTLEHISEARSISTCRFRERYHDKPNISFTDLSSMVVMQQLEIQHILTGDAHFTHVGLGFQVVP